MAKRRVLITCADRYMGPAIQKKFQNLDFDVIAGPSPMIAENQVAEAVDAAGHIDVLVANFAHPPVTGALKQLKSDDLMTLFDELVHPLMYAVRATVPQMLERASGKIIAITSAAPLRGIPNNSAYCAARGAQNSFIKAVGLELARSNIQVNAIAQNYINNDTYYPDDILGDEKFINHLKRNVPTRKTGAPDETAELAAYLASEQCNHMVGQILPLAGGWAT
ncbi:MAG: SDR family oxidoreductase [Porticoccaceae bacterium]|nr:SDR family oxidoreductase [Porticoccaceae bacterium]